MYAGRMPAIRAAVQQVCLVHSSQVPGTCSQLSKRTGTQFKAGVHFEAQCSTTNVGAALAATVIAAGVYDTVLVYGLETTRLKG